MIAQTPAREECMRDQSSFAIIGLMAVCLLAIPAAAQDQSKYPNWKGQWRDIIPQLGGQTVRFDPSKPFGPAQQAPLTPEYQKVLQDSMADQAKGGLGNWPGSTCVPHSMPRMMSQAEFEYIIEPETTYILIASDEHAYRRIFTDSRPWPAEIEPSYAGYSIGQWIDEDGGGRFNLLEVETRGPFKGPRAYDATGLPLAFDNMSVFKERIYLDKNDSNILHDMITVFDHALTRPWTADKRYRRSANPRPIWREDSCLENNANIVIDKENYWLSADHLLMPTKKNQAPPDLRYFKQSQK
jgi:hypothetical protein